MSRRRDAGYAFRVRCPHCKGPLYYMERERVYYCGNHRCPGGDHGSGVTLTDAQVERADPVTGAAA